LSLIEGWYILTFTDDCSHYGWVFFSKNKSNVFGMFQTFQIHVEKQLQNSICILHSDKGGEYISTTFDNYCKQHNIHQQFTQPNMPHQNVVAKQKNKTILNMNCSLASATHLPSFLWAKFINIAIFLMKITFSHSNLGLIPYHILISDKLDVSMLHNFGSVCYIHINSQRKKLDKKFVVGAS